MIPVKIRTQDREDSTSYLRIGIFSRSDKLGSGVSMDLTDDTNPLFLYSFYLRELDFQGFKQEQKIRVEYSSFIEMVTQFLTLAQKEEDDPKFLIEFEVKRADSMLSVIEINRFKETTHLQLRFKASSD